MNKEDSLQFMRERLRHNHSPLHRDVFATGAQPRVTRRFAIETAAGEGHLFEHVDASFGVHCARGTVWITQNGDPKDVILIPGEAYRADREAPVHLFALQPCVLEIEFDDEVTQH